MIHERAAILIKVTHSFLILVATMGKGNQIYDSEYQHGGSTWMEPRKSHIIWSDWLM